MSNIREHYFKSILDNHGNRVVEFGFAYDCDNEKKHSTILIPVDINNLTEQHINDYMLIAAQHIEQRRNGLESKI